MKLCRVILPYLMCNVCKFLPDTESNTYVALKEDSHIQILLFKSLKAGQQHFWVDILRFRATQALATELIEKLQIFNTTSRGVTEPSFMILRVLLFWLSHFKFMDVTSPFATSSNDNWILRILTTYFIFNIKSESLVLAWWNLQNKLKSNRSISLQNVSNQCWRCLKLLTLKVRYVFFESPDI